MNLKIILKQTLIILGILLGIMVVVVLILALVGQFHIDDGQYPGGFGIYYSALKGLPSLFNPLYELIWFCEAVAFILLPVVLYVFRKKLQIQILPWFIVAVFMLIGGIPLAPGMANMDQTVVGEGSNLVAAEFWTAAFMVVAFALAKQPRLFGR